MTTKHEKEIKELCLAHTKTALATRLLKATSKTDALSKELVVLRADLSRMRTKNCEELGQRSRDREEVRKVKETNERLLRILEAVTAGVHGRFPYPYVLR